MTFDNLQIPRSNTYYPDHSSVKTSSLPGLLTKHQPLKLNDNSSYSYHGSNETAKTSLTFLIKKLNDGKFLATVIRNGHGYQGNKDDVGVTIANQYSNTSNSTETSTGYDADGAVYYCVLVICMYAFSILFMIGSSLKKNQQDLDAHRYLKEMAGLQRVQDKIKTRMVLDGGTPRPDRAHSVSNVRMDAIPERRESVLSITGRTHLGEELSQVSLSSWSLISVHGEEGPCVSSDPCLSGRSGSDSDRVWGSSSGIHRESVSQVSMCEVPEIKVEMVAGDVETAPECRSPLLVTEC